MHQMRRFRGQKEDTTSNSIENMPPVRNTRRCSLQRCDSKTNLMENATKNHKKIMKYATSKNKPPLGNSERTSNNNKRVTTRQAENNGSTNQRNNGSELHKTCLQGLDNIDAQIETRYTTVKRRHKLDENNPRVACSLQRSASNATTSSLDVEAGDIRPAVTTSNADAAATKRQNKNLQKMFQKAARKTNAPMMGDGVPVVKENRFVQNQDNSGDKSSSDRKRPPSAMSKSSDVSESEWMKERTHLLTQLKQSRELVRQCLEKMRTAENKASQVPRLELQIVTLKRQLCQEISKNQLGSAISAASSLNSIGEWDDDSMSESRYTPVGVSHNNSPVNSDDDAHRDKKRSIELTSLDRAHAALQRLQNRCATEDKHHRSPIDGASDEENDKLKTNRGNHVTAAAHNKVLKSMKELSERNATQQAEIDQLKRMLYTLMPHSKNQ